jgi:RES domain-containing protein
MTRAAWRIVKPRHTATAFTGEGSRRFGGRWNSKGTAVVYTAGSAALAALEVLVHLDAHDVLQSWQLLRITFDEALVDAAIAGDFSGFEYRVEKRYLAHPPTEPNSSTVNFANSSADQGLIKVTVSARWGDSNTYSTSGVIAE